MLEVKDLKIEFYDHSRPEVAVRDVDFSLKEGEIIGLVGESGSGKSLTATAIAGLIRRGDVKISGEVLWENIDLLKASRRQMRALQGNEIGFVFQDPMTAFSPVHKIGYQVEDALRVHGKTDRVLQSPANASTEVEKNASDRKKQEYTKEELKEKALKALKDVDLPDPERVYNSYPFELSGGMRQRAMIASAMISSPRLLIADEPTTALDVTVQAEIIKLLKRINEEEHTAIIFISHDLGLVRKLCSKVLVLKNGDVVEQGPAEEIFANPKAEYTKKLIAAEVVIVNPKGNTGVPEESGRKVIEMTESGATVSEAGTGRTESAEAKTDSNSIKNEVSDASSVEPEIECEVKNLTFIYPATRRQAQPIGIHNINLTIHKGEIVGLVGESGSGKSTLAKCIAGLNYIHSTNNDADDDLNSSGQPTEQPVGKHSQTGQPVEKRSKTEQPAEKRSKRVQPIVKRPQRVRMIFQDSYSALNPKKRVGWLLRESLRLYGVRNKKEQDDRIRQILYEVELTEEYLDRFPAELSGGQRQRVMIAMALLQKPTLLIADEPVSALDVAIQESITGLLNNLSKKHGVAILFISHDLRTVYTLCDRVCVMKDGRIVEEAAKDELYTNPKEEYTKLLLRSALE